MHWTQRRRRRPAANDPGQGIRAQLRTASMPYKVPGTEFERATWPTKEHGGVFHFAFFSLGWQFSGTGRKRLAGACTHAPVSPRREEP